MGLPVSHLFVGDMNTQMYSPPVTEFQLAVTTLPRKAEQYSYALPLPFPAILAPNTSSSASLPSAHHAILLAFQGTGTLGPVSFSTGSVLLLPGNKQETIVVPARSNAAGADNADVVLYTCTAQHQQQAKM